jgi:phosphoglycerol transferase MdoB-like AlkP superfamily enzyme
MREGRLPASLWRALAASAVPVVACALLALAWLEVGYSPLAIALDVFLVFPVVLGSALLARWRWQPWIAGTCLAALFVVGSAYKVAMMGTPLAPTDASAAFELLQVLPGWRLAMAVAAAVAWAGLLLWSFWPRSAARAAWLALPLLWAGLLAMLPAPLPWLLQSLDGADAPQGSARLQAQGSIVYMLRAEVEYREEMAEVPTLHQVQAAIGALGMQRSAPAQAASWTAARPIHVVLLESLWDARQLGAYRFSSPPMDPRFIAAWEAGGRSSVLSPVLGGATANAEFEFLCAMPALRASVAFDGALRNPVPCLPRILRDAGYETVAIHPHTAGFWNRDEAYPLLGFEHYRPLGSFALDDMDGMFLADASTFRQVVEWDEATQGDARFVWLVSLGSHYPYDRDRNARPDLVQVTPSAPVLQDYANATRYTTAAFMDYVESVLARQPDALIVAFGDHAPVLGTDPDPFAASGIDTGDAAGMVRLSTTPLLVIDGRNGAVDMGQLPLNQLAPRVLALLGEGHPVLPQAPWVRAPGTIGDERLFLNHLLHRKRDGSWQDCSGATGTACDTVRKTRKSLVTVRDDLIRGHQHALGLLGVPGIVPTGMEIARTFAPCVLEVEAWGPQETAAGVPFNVQPGGGSAFWFTLREARGMPRLRFGGQEVPLTIAGKVASAGFASAPAQPGDYPLTWICDDGNEGRIGDFRVLPATSP